MPSCGAKGSDWSVAASAFHSAAASVLVSAETKEHSIRLRAFENGLDLGGEVHRLGVVLEHLDGLHHLAREVAPGLLLTAQRQIGSGYLGGIPQGQQAWAQLAAGQIQVDSFSLNGRWVPWYNLHKIAAGLRDAHVHAAHPDALPMLRAFADWAERVTARPA